MNKKELGALAGIDDTRAEFEAWVKSVPFFTNYDHDVLERDDIDGGYLSAVVHSAWLAWNARGVK